MKRTTIRVTRSITRRFSSAELYCSRCGTRLLQTEQDGRTRVEPCRNCSSRTSLRSLAPSLLLAGLLLSSLPALAFEMQVNGKDGFDQGAAGGIVTFTVTGSGIVDASLPPCNNTTLSYGYESGEGGQTTGSSISLTAKPGSLTVTWSRSGPGGPCNGGGSATGSFYGFSPPFLEAIELDPPNVKIDQVVSVQPKMKTCPVNPTNPNSSDPCHATFSYDPGCPPAMFCTPGNLVYEALGTYTLKGHLENPAGSSENSISISVGATQKPGAFYQILAPTPVAGSPVPFTNETTHGFRSLFWDFGDGTTSTAENPTHVFPAADEYVVKLTATNEIGSDTFETTVTVLAKSGGTAPAAADFTWTPEKPVTGQLVRFTDKSNGTITRWRWNFADGTEPSYEQNPTHTFPIWGQKNVELWVSNEFGRKGIILFVQVLSNTAPPIADFDFTPLTVTVGQPVQFTDTSAGASGWMWDFGEDGATSTLQNPTHTYKTAGQKAVTLRVTNAFGSDSITKFFACHSNEGDPLEAKFTWTPSQPDAGQPVRFIDLSTGSPEKWSWVISDGTQSNERNLTHTFAAAGEYGVSLRVDKGTQTHILAQVLRVGNTSGPIPDFTWTPGTPEPGQTVRFQNLSRDATSYRWSFGDGTTSDAVDPEHVFAEENSYRVTLTARNAAGQSESETKTLIVSSKPVVPIASFIANPNPASPGTPVQFTDTSIGIPTSWSWDFGDTQTSTQQHPTHTFAFEGTFGVRLIARNSAGSSTPVTIPVVIKNQLLPPKADFDWTPDPTVATQPVTFRDKSTNNPKGWSWTFGDGGTGSGSTAEHRYALPGEYPVTLRVSNEAGQSELTRVVVVGNPPLQAEFSFAPEKPFAGKPVAFTDRSTGEVVSWKWLVDGAVVGTTKNLNWTFFSGGEHTVGLEVRGKSGNDSFRQKAIAIQAPPVASFKAVGALVFGSTVTFVDTSSGNPKTRRWYLDDVFSGSASEVQRSFTYTGQVRVRLEVENDAGKDGLTRWYAVGPNTAQAPVIRKITPRYGPCFYSSYPMSNPIDVEIDWRKNAVGSATLEVNAVADPPVPATGNLAHFDLETRRLKYDSTINDLTFGAIGDAGSPSEPKAIKFLGITVPDYFIGTVGRTIEEDKRRSFTHGVYLPPKPFESDSLTFPDFLGGGEFKITKTQFKFEKIMRTDCSVTTTGELSGGIKIGKGFGGIKGSVTANKVLTELDRTLSDELTFALEGFGGWEAKLAADDAIPAMKIPCANAIIREYICKIAEVKVEGQGSLGGSVTLKIKDDGSLEFKDTDKLFKAQVFVTGTLKVGSAKFEAFGGGKASFKIGNFSDPHLIKKADFTGEAGGRIVWLGSLYEYKRGIGCTLQYGKDPKCGENVANLKFEADAAEGRMNPVAPLDRSVPVEVAGPAPVLVQNVSTLADPNASARDGHAVLAFLSEQAAAGASLQRLDVKALRRSRDGAWSAPQSVTADANGDFNPVAAIDANHRAIIAWERIRNAAFGYADIPTLDDMPKLLREMEIAVSVSDDGSTSWSPVEVLSSNDLSDRQPALAALADGRTVLAWIREPAGSTSDQTIVARVLSGTTWSAEQVIASGMRGIAEIALVANGTDARLVVSHMRESGGNDLSLFTFASGAWSARESLTNDTEDDRSPTLADENGTARVYWLRDGALVGRALAGGELERVRERVADAGVANPVAAMRPDGTPVIVWSSGSDIRAVVRDPNTRRWTTDVVLTDTTRSHTALSAYFTPAGTLQIASLGTLLELRNVDSVIDGQPVVIEGVAYPGRSDLLTFETPLRVDLVAHGETFTADPRQPLASERVLISVDVENAGELPVRDAAVEVRRGQGVAGTTTVMGDWMPGETKRVEVPITYDAAQPELMLVVDPAGVSGDAVPANNTAQFSFGNRDPLACFQASAGSGATPLLIALDATCSSDPENAIARYTWSFGDGESATGLTASHTFVTAGTHDVVLTVTDAMGAKSSRRLSIDAASSTDWRAPSSLNRIYLSVVGRAQGVNNTYFVSDLALVNTDAGAPLAVDALYLPDGRADAHHKRFDLAPGGMLAVRDAVAQLFSATNGTGSLRLDLSHPHAVALARTYNDQPSGTAGFSNEGTGPAAALRDGERGVILQHWLPGYRSNIGFTEVDGVASTIVVSAFDEAGAAQGNATFDVGPYGHIQINAHPLLQRRGRIDLEVHGGAVLSYVSTIDGKTGDPIYQSAERVPAPGTRTLLIPIVGRLAGVNDSLWRSDVRVMNAASASQTVTLALRTGAGTFTTSRSLSAGETLAYDDVITNAFPALTGNISATLLVTASGPIIATSRTFNLSSGGTYGLYVPARPRNELTSEGESAWLAGLQENGTYRCNLGIASFEEPVVVSVRAFDASGVTLAVKEYAAAAGQNLQVGRVFADMGLALPISAAGIEVTVIQGTAFVYASVIDNRTGDSTFVEARK